MTIDIEHIVATARRVVPWVLFVAVVVTLGSASITGDLVTMPWRVALIGGALVAAIVSRFANRNPAWFGVVILAGVVHLTVSGVDRRDTAGHHLSWTSIVIDGLVALGLVGLLMWAIVLRRGRPSLRDLVEAIVVLLGAALATWVVLVQPLTADGVALSKAALAGLLVPLNVLVATFLVDLWNDGLRTNRSLQMASTAAVLMTGGGVALRFGLVDDLALFGPTPAIVAYSLACGLMFAAMAHVDGRREIIVAGSGDAPSHPRTRLLIMGAAVFASATLMALVAPSGAIDRTVRLVGTVALIALVVVRLAIAQFEHELARASLQQRVNLDDLTGLPSRPRFVELVRDRLEDHWRTAQHPTVFHLNLDRFKHINDSFGHHGANEVLVEVARRLDELASRAGFAVGRLGGDDFAIVDSSTRNVDEARARVEEIRCALGAPFTIRDTTLVVTASIGVAVVPEKRTLSAEELLRRADIANHQAKLEGTSRTAVFDDSMQASVIKRMDVEHALHGAIGRQEMRLYHQPIVDVRTGRVTGFEALIRWQRSDGTMVSPGAFIPVAEDTGIICELGAWALADALSRLREWIDAGVVDPDTTISVNVSPRQIADPNFPDIVRRTLDGSGLPPELLWLEMTESMMLEEPELAESTLRTICAMGVRWALDDFGTGFSSLSLLQRFPIQRIKIDRAFVQGIADNANDRSLVRTVIAMAHSMDLDLVAEGVETVHQLKALRQMGCHKAQGYLISHPVPPEALRTTMSGLADLVSMPLFSEDDYVPAIDHEYEPLVTTPAPTPISSGSRGPLGQPVL